MPGGYTAQAWHHMLQNAQSHHLVQVPLEVSMAGILFRQFQLVDYKILRNFKYHAGKMRKCECHHFQHICRFELFYYKKIQWSKIWRPSKGLSVCKRGFKLEIEMRKSVKVNESHWIYKVCLKEKLVML